MGSERACLSGAIVDRRHARHRSGLTGSFVAKKFRPRDARSDGAGQDVAAQDGHLMSQGDEFELQRGATTNPEQEQKGTKGGQKREHADDGMTAATETLHLLGFLEF